MAAKKYPLLLTHPSRRCFSFIHQLLGMVAAADRAAKDKGGKGKGQGNTAEEQEGDEEDRLDLSQVRLFVLDEADKLIADSGIPAVMQIFAKCPGGGSGIHRLQVHIILFCIMTCVPNQR